MKVIGVSFSSRKNGNCAGSINYCLSQFDKVGYETELISLYDYNINSCGLCGYK